MKYRLPLIAVASLALALAACGGGGGCGDDTPTPAAGETPGFTPAIDTGSPEASPKVEPVPERTGDAALDAVLDAFIMQDTKPLLPLLRYQTLPCGVDDGQGALPPCRPDQEVGAMVEVMPVSACEFAYYRPHEFELLLPAIVQTEVYGVYEATPDVRFPGDYVIVVTQPDPEDLTKVVASEATVTDGRLVGYAFSCALPPEELVARDGLGEPLWAPQPTPEATP